ncbi:hypothetical protein L4C36_05465 [Photobacterium japonica]|uniref:hypothetical protein n=1 Tax=Photobacterium japonica TaxID=2910235 RepID=UPI003D0C2757
MMKQGWRLTRVATMAMLLSACGGGGGGDSAGEGNTGGGSGGEATCTGTDFTCAYNTDDITVNVHLTVSPDYKLQPRALFASAAGALYPSSDEKLIIRADGQDYDADILNATQDMTVFPDVPYGAPVYDIEWYRGGDLIASKAIEHLATPVFIASAGQHDGSDTVVVEWVEESDHTFDVDLYSLACDKADGTVTYIEALTSENINPANSPFEISLVEDYGVSIDALQQDYTACNMSMYVTSTHALTSPETPPRELLIRSSSPRQHEVALF